MRANVYFTREITPEKVVELYRALGVELPGKVAVKVHSGEKGNQNFLRPEFWCPMVEEVHGTIVSAIPPMVMRPAVSGIIRSPTGSCCRSMAGPSTSTWT